MAVVFEDELKKGVEHDLHARLGLTLAFDKDNQMFVIKKIANNEIQYDYLKLEDAVRRCNQLEGAKNTYIGYTPPRDCNARKDGLYCIRPKGHRGKHKAYSKNGNCLATW